MKKMVRVMVMVVVAVMVVTLAYESAVAQDQRPDRGGRGRGGGDRGPGGGGFGGRGGGDRGPGGGDRGRGGFGGGGFDLERMTEMRMERYRGDLDFSDEEWDVISPFLKDVLAKQTEMMMSRGFGGRGRGGSEGSGNPKMEALRAALDADDTSAEKFKTLIKDYRAEVKKKQNELKKAQAKLVDVLTARQEAYLVSRSVLE